MEIEQEISRFLTVFQTKLEPTSSFFADYQAEPTRYRLSNPFKIYQKAISKCYQGLDKIAGENSYFILNFSHELSRHPLQELLKLLIDNNFISHWFIRSHRYNDAPYLHRMTIRGVFSKEMTDGAMPQKGFSHSCGKDPNEVISKAIGEFLERYFLAIYYKKNLIKGSLKNLKSKGMPTINLDLLACFSEEQKRRYPERRFDEESLFYWEKVKRVSTGETIYAPAQLVHWNYLPDANEPILLERNTNGAGGFFSLEGAICAGLYEIIQRDGFLIYWLNKITPRRINPKTIPSERFQEFLKEIERYGFEVYCLDVTTDLKVPAFVVVVADPSGKSPRFCLGGGCQADPEKAIYRALEEAWSVHYWIRPLPYFRLKDFQPFFTNINQEERLRLAANPEMEEHYKFLFSGKEISFSELNFDFPKEFKSPKEELDFLIKRVESLGQGYEVYYFQARHPFLKQVGYYSTQVIVPQLIPLYLYEIDAPLGSLRLKEVPQRLGFAPLKEFNPIPHLFP